MIASDEALKAQIIAAAPLLLGAAVATAAILVMAPPNVEQFAASDPLIRAGGPALGPWLAIVVSLVIAGGWLARQRPRGHAVASASRLFAAGAVVAVAGALAIRAIGGPHLPPFVPSEESAAPGLGLGLSAGLLEEAAFRFALVPLIYFAARRVMPSLAAAILAIVLTGFAFALSHELGAEPFDPAHFATRVVFPGCVMNALFFRPGPALILGAHWTAHIAIYLLFAPTG